VQQRIGLAALQFFAALVLVAIIGFYPGAWNLARWIGLVITIPSVILLLTARLQLGSSFSVTPQARHLVTNGIYSRIRNPIYIFGGLAVLGVVLALQKPLLYIIFIILIPIQIVRAHKEAKVLEEKFGDEYREYRKKTWF
jgi:protein-S-isoprenylcysteine O-methyltransferase Ste14